MFHIKNQTPFRPNLFMDEIDFLLGRFEKLFNCVVFADNSNKHFNLRVKLSTKGVNPSTLFTKTSPAKARSTKICLCLLSLFTKLLKSNPQFKQISATHAPIGSRYISSHFYINIAGKISNAGSNLPMRPNIPPLAPTDIISGRKIALKIVPPIAGTTNRSILAAKP